MWKGQPWTCLQEASTSSRGTTSQCSHKGICKMRKAILLISLLLCLDAAAQRFSVGTNAVDWLSLGTMNMEASAAVSRSVSFHLGAG
ncbi:MAG: DUF3575 domain-containing protein, partial [Bacteroidales bacterium]|nr:DUF3575 domain-containing protein [Bacteroidales bacterium]